MTLQRTGNVPTGNHHRYPFATAPDIIRSFEKDKYYQETLLERLVEILRSFYGSHYLQSHIDHVRAFSQVLYFGCTTLLGNRTLGEEYCDVLQVERRGLRLPSLYKRSTYIASHLLLPYCLTKVVPRFREYLGSKIRSSLMKDHATHKTSRSFMWRLKLYVIINLEAFTSLDLLYGLSLVAFYFGGAYYHLSKRALGLRYVLSKSSTSFPEDMSYEVLGVFLMLQMIVQGWTHAQNALHIIRAASADSVGHFNAVSNTIEVPLFQNMHKSHPDQAIVHATIVTPVPQTPRVMLSEQTNMKWIIDKQQRRCTLCLEGMKDPSAASCGHIFCWKCISDWIKEKPECPLCRHSIQERHLLPLR